MTMKMGETRVVATGTVTWPPVIEMRRKITERLQKNPEPGLTVEKVGEMDDAEVLEAFKTLAAKQ